MAIKLLQNHDCDLDDEDSPRTIGISLEWQWEMKTYLEQEMEPRDGEDRRCHVKELGTVSLFSNSTSAKRDIDDSGEENRGDLKGGARKKLKLTKKQSFVLEESFKQHSTLNPKEKQTLAKSLNLQPRQVEIWFQNRRARTKLKQNEVDCALLKKCYEALTSDNMRLKREIHQLKETKSRVLPELLYKQFPAAGTCPSCDRIGTASIDTTKTSKTLLVRATKSHSHFFS
ncbi:hypothetical protein E3N88_23870 [Mikania micrantha]|uniref:Homeobox domain-containing protein n=1 Tax=Mikania micrantha TaxID=192012 RepID=A0A5N6NFK1_9ASTR|nr:hypothetical protein E3N88_23870 [Mikania micrantha]